MDFEIGQHVMVNVTRGEGKEVWRLGIVESKEMTTFRGMEYYVSLVEEVNGVCAVFVSEPNILPLAAERK